MIKLMLIASSELEKMKKETCNVCISDLQLFTFNWRLLMCLESNEKYLSSLQSAIYTHRSACEFIYIRIREWGVRLLKVNSFELQSEFCHVRIFRGLNSNCCGDVKFTCRQVWEINVRQSDIQQRVRYPGTFFLPSQLFFVSHFEMFSSFSLSVCNFVTYLPVLPATRVSQLISLCRVDYILS